jgi:hypothetical protein
MSEQCDHWYSHDDISGEGQMTFYWECVLDRGHEGPHEVRCSNPTWQAQD